MAYGVKYQLLADSKKYSNDWVVRLSFDGYAGAEVDRDVPTSPFFLNIDKAWPIKGSSLKFSMRGQTDFDFAGFFTYSSTYIKAELLKGATVRWSGFLLPEQFDEPYKSPPFSASFIASDGIGRLKEIDYTPDDDNITQLKVIDNCLRETGLVLAYSIAIRRWEAGHDTTRSPLAQTYVDDSIYEGVSCYEVLTDILSLYDAMIVQWNNRWFIFSDIDLGATRMLYTSSLVYDTTEAAPALYDMDLPAADVYPVDGPLQSSLEPACGSINVVQDLGYDGNMLENGDFTGFFSKADVTIDGWLIYNAGAAHVDVVEAQNKYWFKFKGYQQFPSTFTRNMEQDITVVNDPDAGGFVLSFEVCLLAWHTTAELQREVLSGRSYKVMVAMTSGGNTQYLTTAGWSTSVGYITGEIDSVIDVISGTEIKIITDELPYASGVIKVRLYGIVSTFAEVTNTIAGIYYTAVRAYFLADETSEYPSTLEGDFVINAAAREVADNIELISGDAYDILNKELYYKSKLMLSDDTPTESWTLDGKFISQSLVLQMVRSISSRLYNARLKLSGTIKCNDLNYTAIITHVWNNNIMLEIEEMEYNLYEDKARVTLIERKAWAEFERWIGITETAIAWAYDDAEAEAITRTVTCTMATWTVNSTPVWLSYKVLSAADADITATPASWVSGCKLKLYPGSDNTGSTRTGVVILGDASGDLVDIDVSQAGSGAITASVIVAPGNTFTISDESASIVSGSTTLSYEFTPASLNVPEVTANVYRNDVLDASELLSCQDGLAVSETITVTEAVAGDVYVVEVTEETMD